MKVVKLIKEEPIYIEMNIFIHSKKHIKNVNKYIKKGYSISSIKKA